MWFTRGERGERIRRYLCTPLIHQQLKLLNSLSHCGGVCVCVCVMYACVCVCVNVCSKMKSSSYSTYLNANPSPPHLSTLCPSHVIHMTSVPRPSLSLLLLPCITLNTHVKPKNKNKGGLGKGMRLGGNPSVYISSFHGNETR